MALPETRSELIEYCLRKLGKPVIEINVEEQQVEDRIDDTLSYFQDYHFDGVEKIYLKHKVTATAITFNGNYPGFTRGETITGATSGATAIIVDQPTNSTIRIQSTLGTFANGEVITGATTSTTATLASSDAVVLGDIDNKYIEVPDNVISVSRLMQFNGFGANSGTMFDIRYQLALTSMNDLTQLDMVSWTMIGQQYSLIHDVFIGQKNLRFNRKQGKVSVDFKWGTDIAVDQYLIFDCWAALDPETYAKIYGDLFVREYATCLIKIQWAANLKKFQNMKLPGEVQFDAQKLYDEAVEEKKIWEERLRKELQCPPSFLVG